MDSCLSKENKKLNHLKLTDMSKYLNKMKQQINFFENKVILKRSNNGGKVILENNVISQIRI
jgi:hypothetical protein